MATNQRELCRYFLNGVCRFGSNCFNSHDRNDKPSNICQYYLKGICAYGSSCRYEHVKPSKGNSKESSSAASSSTNCENQSSNMLILRKTKNNSLENSASNEEISTTSTNDADKISKSYFEALTGDKLSNLNSIEYDPFDESSNRPIDLDKISQLCPLFEKDGSCPFGPECQYVHGEICDLCGTPCLHPFNEELREQHKQECTKQIEADMEEAFATQRSQDKQCGICMEIVWEKDKTDQCFGVLENCNHVFCLACIRKWRQSKTCENKIVKACPECRVKSDFITPSHFWFENESDKIKIIEDYKNKLGKTACKYFKQGSGHCPFGNKCFYQHTLPDGTKAELPSPRQRRRLNQNGVLESFSNLVRVDFDISDDESDYDIFEFIRNNLINDTIDTESDFSEISLSEFFDEFLFHYN